jgi:hypothetical protein
MKDKEQHELAMGNELLEKLRYDAQFSRHGKDDGEPDLIYTRVGKPHLGIEVGTVYYDQDHAELEWRHTRVNQKRGPQSWKSGYREPYKLIAVRVQRELNKKCQRSYSRKDIDAVWLYIDQRAPLADVAETDEMVRNLKMPEKHKFDRIFLCHHAHLRDGAGIHIYDLLSRNRLRFDDGPEPLTFKP